MFNMILYILNPSRSNNPNNPKPPYSRKSYPRALHPWHCPMSLRCRWRLFRRPLPVVCRSLPAIVSQRPMGMLSRKASAAGENCALTGYQCLRKNSRKVTLSSLQPSLDPPQPDGSFHLCPGRLTPKPRSARLSV